VQDGGGRGGRCIQSDIVSHSHSCVPDVGLTAGAIGVWCVAEWAIEGADCCAIPSGSSSSSWICPFWLLESRRWRFGATAIGRFKPAPLLGGAAAIGITEFFPGAGMLPLVGVLADDSPDGGDSDPARLFDCADVGVVVAFDAIEFFRMVVFFAARVEAPETGAEFPLPLFRFLMTSVLRESGRTTPWSFRNNPQALHRGWPSGFLLHSGVVCVKQLVHVVGIPFPFAPLAALLPLVLSGDGGREGSAELKPVSGGELGPDCMPRCIAAWVVEVVRAIFCRRNPFGSGARFRTSLTEVLIECDLLWWPPPVGPLFQSCGEWASVVPPILTVFCCVNRFANCPLDSRPQPPPSEDCMPG